MISKSYRCFSWRRVIVSILFFGVAMVQSMAQSDLMLNGDFESLNLYNIEGSFNIDGVEIKSLKRKDIFHARWLMGDSIQKTYVASAHWNFNDDSTTVGTTFYSNTGNANNGYAFGSITPFARREKTFFQTTHLAGRTCQPLIEGHTYRLSFWVKFARGNILVNHIDVFFSDTIRLRDGMQKVDFKRKKIISLPEESSPYPIEKLPSDCKVLIPESTIKGYQKVSCEYIARGGETYIYFGNLDYELPDKVLKVTVADTGKKKWQTPFCDYYIDDVELVSQDESEICVERKKETLVTLADTITDLTPNMEPKPVLKKEIEIGDQYFASGSYELNETNILELEQILSTIDYEQVSVIKITGHTDNVGGLEDNQILSLKRAEAIGEVVQTYFPNIRLIGMGETQPKYSNETAEGRLKNRRVVLELVDKK